MCDRHPHIQKIAKLNMFEDINSLRGYLLSILDDSSSPFTELLQVVQKMRGIDTYTQEKYIYDILELAAFLASVQKQLDDFQERSVLCLGVQYGIEVMLLRMFNIKAFGIEKDDDAYTTSLQLLNEVNRQKVFIPPLPSEIFIHTDIFSYIQSSSKTFPFILGRNLNPLANVSEFLPKVSSILEKSGVGIVQWDALYREIEAHELYAPKQGILYADTLHTLLRNIHGKKLRARFVYEVRFI